MCYFKVLENTLRKYHLEFKQCTDEEQRKLLKAQIDLLKELLAYIKQGDWAYTKNNYERIMYTLREGVDVAAEKYMTTENCIYASLSKAATRVEKLIGTEVLEYLQNGDVELARFLFYKNTKQLKDIVVSDVLKKVNVNSTEQYDLRDCTDELKHLKVYTTAFIDKVFNKCDMQKLAFIVYLLTTQDKQCVKQQQELYKYLTK